MNYLKVLWKHESENYPIVMYSELSSERYEIRKVEVFIDGSYGFASENESIGRTILGEVPVPTVSEIAEDPEFEAFLIDKSEFEDAWVKAKEKVD